MALSVHVTTQIACTCVLVEQVCMHVEWRRGDVEGSSRVEKARSCVEKLGKLMMLAVYFECQGPQVELVKADISDGTKNFLKLIIIALEVWV